MPTRVSGVLVLFALAALSAGAADPPACRDVDGFHRLDFWLGDWDVVSADGELYGTNRIEPILEGCAVQENWVDRDGGEGKSWFFYSVATDTWKQVWITEQAARTGGLKEKTLVASYDGPGVRFRGEIALASGHSYHDRTTLVPLDDGRVRQTIETSRDGVDWRVGFDAYYVRREAPGER